MSKYLFKRGKGTYNSGNPIVGSDLIKIGRKIIVNAFNDASDWINTNGANILAHLTKWTTPTTAGKMPRTLADGSIEWVDEPTGGGTTGADVRLSNLVSDLTENEQLLIKGKLNINTSPGSGNITEYPEIYRLRKYISSAHITENYIYGVVGGNRLVRWGVDEVEESIFTFIGGNIVDIFGASSGSIFFSTRGDETNEDHWGFYRFDGNICTKVLSLGLIQTIWAADEDSLGTIFIGVYSLGVNNSRIYKSIDDGVTFVEIFNPNKKHCHDIRVDKTNNYIYACFGDVYGDDNNYRSTDGGVTWEEILIGKTINQFTAVLPVNGARLFGSDQSPYGRIYRSVDDIDYTLVLDTHYQNVFWLEQSDLTGFIYAGFWVDPSANTNLFCEIWYSKDLGLTWEMLIREENVGSANGFSRSSRFFRGNLISTFSRKGRGQLAFGITENCQHSYSHEGISGTKLKPFYAELFTPEYNTFIGGLADILPDKYALAEKLGIEDTNIIAFEIIKNNVCAKIEGNYTGGNLFSNNKNITYYIDPEGKWTEFYGTATFIFAENLKIVDLPGVTVLPGQNHFAASDKLQIINIHKATTLGDNAGETDIFNLSDYIYEIYAHTTLATNNAGSMDGDLAYAKSLGAKIIFANNYDKPSAITDLRQTGVYGESIKLTFTAPESTNALKYFAVFVDNTYHQLIGAGENIIVTNLKSRKTYEIKVIAIDEFFNHSEYSNSAKADTAFNLIFPDLSEVSWYNDPAVNMHYPLTVDALDAKGMYNGINNDVTFIDDNGVLAGSFNGTSSYIRVPDASNYNDSQTIMFWAKGLGRIYGKGSDTTDGSGLRLTLNEHNFNAYFVQMSPIVGAGANWANGFNSDEYYHYAFVYDNASNYFMLYINGIFFGRSIVRMGDGLRGTSHIFIGAEALLTASPDTFFTGNIRDFVHVKRILSPYEIIEASIK